VAAEERPRQRGGQSPRPAEVSWLLPILGGSGKVQIAAAAGILTVLIAVVGGAAMCVGSYLTERLGQCVGNDLRVRLYHHLQELSLAYYDTNRVGAILNTLTGDVQTIQSFASTSTLTIVTDVLSLIGMIVVMFLLRWDFALIAIAVIPLLAVFALRINKAVRSAVGEVRNRQSDLLATLQEGLQSIEVIKAFSREDRQE
jgi:ABC-type multidrug transport system fused ATPase/permease subunit